ncbi:hypothetical protein K431DRAFT_229217 [Polychaeton citri CBS 116435]|uniref:UBL3-like ubiquitin domain-containing protein n=1 Tax=Polychaeton citri CBS 116435 TaxID=1314669 RepID=A0A9P4Q698_9PEZI|nr:hypothetical protein K431DRAFT_229217 [Polychaeton citri CBS 116435]
MNDLPDKRLAEKEQQHTASEAVESHTDAGASAPKEAEAEAEILGTQAATTSSLPHHQQHPPLSRAETEALGPSTDAPLPTSIPSSAAGPTLHISLMLTTGARHPYKIDEKYLRNRKVDDCKDASGSFDPRELSGYKLKELIWTDWRSEWDPRPSSPSLIRLIILGRMLDDKKPLKDFPFSLAQPNVVHMTVKPADLVDDDAEGGGKGSAKGGSLRMRDSEDVQAGCCKCVIQ